MREIKFRGKSKQDYETSIDSIQKGDWVYGYYYFCRSRMCGVIKTTMQEECGGVGSGVVQVDIEVDIQTLGQFTVLKDRCDKEIYEGDIVAYKEGLIGSEVDYIFTVIFMHGNFILESTEDHEYNDYLGAVEHIYIIGNIYENPELVGGTQKCRERRM